MKHLTKEQVRILATATTDIEDVLENGGAFGHNLISSALRWVAQEIGRDAANDLVIQFGLTEHFGIHPVLK